MLTNGSEEIFPKGQKFNSLHQNTDSYKNKTKTDNEF